MINTSKYREEKIKHMRKENEGQKGKGPASKTEEWH
jgi:hypothetical protein